MSIIDLIQGQDDADAVGQAMLLAQALMDGPREAGPRSFCYSGPPFLKSIDRRAQPFGAQFGVRGVGVVAANGFLRAAILRSSPAGSFSQTPLKEVKDLQIALQSVIREGFQSVANATVVHISEPEFQAAPGDAVSAALNGTAGVQLNWGSGLDGILTAGHVGKSAGTKATIGGGSGSVVLALDPTNNGASPEADVSVIQLPQAVPTATRITSTTTAGPRDAVTITTRGGKSVTANIMGQMQWLWLPKSSCTCGHVYMTTNYVTSQGDSGAPVLKGGSVIGHVIAASVGMTTYIQLIDYQLQQIRNQSTFSAASL
jgi:hypothetical protein